MKLFNALVKPILLDFWGALKLSHNNPIENVHPSFCKQLLGVKKQIVHVCMSEARLSSLSFSSPKAQRYDALFVTFLFLYSLFSACGAEGNRHELPDSRR